MTFAARLIENNFGDGYRQTAPDGLNAVVGTLNAVWDLLTQDQANYITNFLTANVGRPFYMRFPVPNGPVYLFDCKQWTRDNVSGANDKMTATFVQRFDLPL